MLAVRVQGAGPIAPFDEGAGALPVLGRTLREVQDEALAAAGFTLGDDLSRPRLVFGEGTFFTASLLRKLRKNGQTGRLRVRDERWLRMASPLASDPERPRVGFVNTGEPATLEGLGDLEFDLGLQASPPATVHPAFAHVVAEGGVVCGPAIAHDIEHWVHLVRVNLLGLTSKAAEITEQFTGAPWWWKLGRVAQVLWAAGWPSEANIHRAVCRVGKGAKIHPTAVVEVSEIGAGAVVGPLAVVRGSVVGAGATIDAQAHVVASSVGARAQVGRGAHLALSVLAEGAMVSQGWGHQASVFGRDSFVAQGVTTLDLSFGAPIRVSAPAPGGEGGPAGAAERRLSTGTHFLGSCVGHRAKVGAGVRLGFGMAVPNDALLVAPARDLARRWPRPVVGAATVEGGEVVPVRGA